MQNVFKWRHFQSVFILQCVRWYLKYGLSYRDLEEMMSERGIEVDHTTIYRWVMKYSQELKKRARWYAKDWGTSWQVDETYVKVKGRWKYLYRAITKEGETVDFYLSHKRNAKAAKRFLKKALRVDRGWVPSSINTDKNPAYIHAIKEIRSEDPRHADIEHRQVKYLNNRLESDHGKLKRLIKPMLGFKSMKSANATLAGYEFMRMFKKGQFETWLCLKNKTEREFIHELFGIYAG